MGYSVPMACPAFVITKRSGLGHGLLRKFGFVMAVITCSSLVFSQAPKSAVESITSALKAREFGRATELSRAALKEFPNDAQLWTLQAIALVNQGDSKNALVAFQRALKIAPDYVAALAGAGQLLYQPWDPKGIPLRKHLLQLRPAIPTPPPTLAG